MRSVLLRAGAPAFALLASTALTAPVMAQSAPPPRFNQVDGNGVDLVTGDFFFSMVEGTIGSGEGALTLVRNWAGPAGWTDNWSGVLYRRTAGGTVQMVVEFGSYSDTFSISGGTYSSTKADGATLVELGNGAFRYTASDGTQIDYASRSGDLAYPMRGPACSFADADTCAIPMSIRRPSGMTYTMNWDVLERCFHFDAELNCTDANAFFRWRGVSNSANYAFTINYATDVPGSAGAPASNWYRRSQAQFTNLDSPPATLPTVTYTGVPSSSAIDVTDTGGETWRLTNGAGGRLTGIRRAGASADSTAIGYGTNSLTVTREGVATGYAWSDDAARTMTVTDAASHATTIVSDMAIGRITLVTDPLSRQTSFQYDGNGRLTRVTQPEGNYVGYTYDSRGNVTEIRAVAKPNSGLADIVTRASYETSCANPVVCNLPNSTTDARNNSTDYSYDGNHGGLLSVTAPAPASGADRPQIRYSYTQISAVTGEPVYLLTGVSSCQSGVAPSCLGTANEGLIQTAYDSHNLRAISVTRRNGTNSLSAVSAFAYDSIGNLLTVDGPLSGTADTTRFRYDAARRTVGVVGPDPDGAGALKYRAVRTTYTNGLPTRIEAGTVDSQSDAHWAAFSALQRVEQDYDADARPTVRRLMAGSTIYSLSQTGYDSLGRVRCTALRMNSAHFAAASYPSDACALDTPGDFGFDRIGRVSYDAAGQVTLVQTGYGVAGVQADEVAATWSGNGQTATVTDANGNKTSYVHDGHDRLSQTQFPSLTTPGSSNSEDYEQLGYDANSNVTSRRTRSNQTIAFAYDALNRMTLRDIPSPVTGESDILYFYDNYGRPTLVADSLIPYNYVLRAYDPLGRITLESTNSGQRGLVADEAGRLIRMDWDGGPKVSYDRLLTGEVVSMRENPTGGNFTLATFGYDDLGRRTLITRGNGTVTSYGYDPASRLGQLVQNLGGTTNDVTFDYSHNPAGEIVSMTRSNDAYAYTGQASGNTADTVNRLNQVTQTGAANVSHDSRGNRTAIGSTTYAYTTENRLRSAGSGSLAYNPEGSLLSAAGVAATKFDTLLGHIITERDSNGTRLRRFVPGPDMDEPMVWYEGSDTATRRWYHADERGSVIAVSDASGNLVGSVNRYDDFGAPQGGSITGRFGYTGQPWLAEAGSAALYHYRARAYSPALGRFMQTDPIGYAGGMNLYAYVGNNPVNRTDPMGLQVSPEDEAYCDAGRMWDDHPCVNYPSYTYIDVDISRIGGGPGDGPGAGGDSGPDQGECTLPGGVHVSWSGNRVSISGKIQFFSVPRGYAYLPNTSTVPVPFELSSIYLGIINRTWTNPSVGPYSVITQMTEGPGGLIAYIGGTGGGANIGGPIWLPDIPDASDYQYRWRLGTIAGEFGHSLGLSPSDQHLDGGLMGKLHMGPLLPSHFERIIGICQSQ